MAPSADHQVLCHLTVLIANPTKKSISSLSLLWQPVLLQYGTEGGSTFFCPAGRA